jgi:hypothetical protein
MLVDNYSAACGDDGTMQSWRRHVLEAHQPGTYILLWLHTLSEVLGSCPASISHLSVTAGLL